MSAQPEASTSARTIDDIAIDTVRFLSADAVEKAKSGHPGLPMGMADPAYLLWTRFLRWQPQDPAWPGRDRFVLSAGHGSMLLYSLLHLSGYDLPLEQLQRFRQLGSITPGHPEHGLTPGVETTTGPLGQGFGNGVGLALASNMLAARFHEPGFTPFAQRVYGIVSDGDLMEGVASEAASLAGHFGLGNLIYLYDDNHISIEGNTSIAFTEDVAARFEAYGWHTEHVSAYDHADFMRAMNRALGEVGRPSLILCRSHIGYGAPHKQDTAQAHGEPLGADELAAAKRARGWPESPSFLIPPEVRERFAARAAELRPEYDEWQRAVKAWRAKSNDNDRRWRAFVEREIAPGAFDTLTAAAPTGAAATRAHGGQVLQRAAALVPQLVGGSADLEPSTKTWIKDSPAIARGEFAGRNFHFGVREHGMGSIVNGLALGGFVPYGSSFLVFTDYARPSIRLSALMKLQVVWVFTHDSVFLGEDGPTHEPIEHLGTLRAIPNLLVIRPADGLETAAAWGLALERTTGPTLIVLTRQTLPEIERAPNFDRSQLKRGAYVVRESKSADAITLIATGSEVGLASAAAALLETRGVATRVVSMAAPQLFLAADAATRDAVLPPRGLRVSIEAGATDYWHRLIGERGLAIGIDRFGESAPLAQIQEFFGFTPEKIAERVAAWREGLR
jgi:transketolase